jgi:hypothetical protein
MPLPGQHLPTLPLHPGFIDETLLMTHALLLMTPALQAVRCRLSVPRGKKTEVHWVYTLDWDKHWCG